MRKTPDIRIKPKETADIEGLKVTNSTAASILVRKTAKSVEVVNCCLEEQGM